MKQTRETFMWSELRYSKFALCSSHGGGTQGDVETLLIDCLKKNWRRFRVVIDSLRGAPGCTVCARRVAALWSHLMSGTGGWGTGCNGAVLGVRGGVFWSFGVAICSLNNTTEMMNAMSLCSMHTDLQLRICSGGSLNKCLLNCTKLRAFGRLLFFLFFPFLTVVVVVVREGERSTDLQIILFFVVVLICVFFNW